MCSFQEVFTAPTNEKVSGLHLGAKCLVWVKKCCHIWLDILIKPNVTTLFVLDQTF